MIRRVAEQRFEDCGDGLCLYHLLEPDEGEMYGAGKLCIRIRLKPGGGIDYHRHDEEMECYIITAGCCEVSDDGVLHNLEAGDVLLTKDQHSHSIYNRSTEDCEFIAIILNKI